MRFLIITIACFFLISGITIAFLLFHHDEFKNRLLNKYDF